MQTFCRLLSAIAAAGLFGLAGCRAEKVQEKKENYTFIVGPQRDWTGGKDLRLKINMPARYVELTPDDSSKSQIEVGEFTFAVRYPSGTPVPHDQLGFRDVLLLTAFGIQATVLNSVSMVLG